MLRMSLGGDSVADADADADPLPLRSSLSSEGVLSAAPRGSSRAVASYLYVSSSSEGEPRQSSEAGVDALTEAHVAAYLHDDVVRLLWARLCAVRHEMASA